MVRSMVESGKHLLGPSVFEINRWITPNHGWVKVNIDGAFAQASNTNACGGLIRDSDGNFIRGFICRLDNGDALSTKLCAYIHALKLAWVLGYFKIELEYDSKEAIDSMQKGCDPTHLEYEVIEEARLLVHRGWETRMRHVLRRIKGAVDRLAKCGLEALLGFHQVLQIPEDLAHIVAKDCKNTSSCIG